MQSLYNNIITAIYTQINNMLLLQWLILTFVDGTLAPVNQSVPQHQVTIHIFVYNSV